MSQPSHAAEQIDPILQRHPNHRAEEGREPHASITELQASHILSHFSAQSAGNVGGGPGQDVGGQHQQQHQQGEAGPGSFEGFGAYVGGGDVGGSSSAGLDGQTHGLVGSDGPHQGDLGFGSPHRQQQGQIGHLQQQHQHGFGQPTHLLQQHLAGMAQQHRYQPQPGLHPSAHVQQQQQSPVDPTLKRAYEQFASGSTGGAGGGDESDENDADVDDIQDLQYLRHEVKRLRRALRQSTSTTPPHQQQAYQIAPNGQTSQQHMQQQLAALSQHQLNSVDFYGALAGGGDPLPAGSSAQGGQPTRRISAGRKGKKVEDLDEEERKKRNALTGKRETTPRHHALNKAIRDKMKELMGIIGEDRLPSPDDPQPPPPLGMEHAIVPVYARPNWKAGVKAESNKHWLESVARAVLEEGQQALRSDSTSTKDAKNRIPPEDLDYDLMLKAAKTSFSNFTKKWVSQNDPAAMQKAIVDAKRGRRWARKDLKQKKRSKAALDPEYSSLYSAEPHPHLLKLDYMSSEYSSEADDAGLEHGPLAVGAWEVASGRDPNPELNKGKGEKVLEIRTPRWRSEKLTEILSNLDEIAGLQAKAIKGNFYTAPALKRFKLTPLRDLPIPSVDAPLEEWEFDPVWLGQGSDQVDEIRRKLGLASLLGDENHGGVAVAQTQEQQHQQQAGLDGFYGMDMMGDMGGIGGEEFAQGEDGGQQ